MDNTSNSNPNGLDVISIALEDIGRWDSQLLELVTGEKIDPWDVDIVLLTQKYLEKINGMVKLDFRIPGKAVITAAVLLRLKSETLMEKKLQDIGALRAGANGGLPRNLIVPELVPIRRVVERKITLVELVEALRGAFEVEKKKIHRKQVLDRLIKISSFDMSQLIDGIKYTLSEVFKNREKISLADLPTREEFTLLFLAILHLATEGFLDIDQVEWNSEITVMRPGALPVPTPVPVPVPAPDSAPAPA